MDRHSRRPRLENNDALLLIEISDESLEMAASTTTGAAVSFPGAPTISVLVVCCSVDDGDQAKALG